MFKWAQSTLSSVAGTAEPEYGPSAIGTVIQRADAANPYSEITSADLKWQTPSGTNVETQTFHLASEAGHYGLAQVIYSNVAGLKTTVQFNAKVWHPSNPKEIVWSSTPLKNYSIGEDRTSFYADNVAMILSEDGGSYKIKSMVDPDALVNIVVTRLSPGFKIGDGRSTYGTDQANPWGEIKHVFWPRNKVEGTFVIKGKSIDFTGRCSFSHALQNMKPHHAAARWNFADFQGPSTSALMMEFTTPPAYGLTKVNIGGLAKDGALITGTIDNTAEHVESVEDPEAKWPEPTHVKFTWRGKTADGKPVEAVLDKVWGERMDRVDVMHEVPAFIKKVVANAAGTRPYIYQYCKPATLKLTIGDQTTEEEGVVFSEATFIS